jgi:hypothetical protein
MTNRQRWEVVYICAITLAVFGFTGGIIRGVVSRFTDHRPYCYATLTHNHTLITTRIGDGKCNKFIVFYQPEDEKP